MIVDAPLVRRVEHTGARRTALEVESLAELFPANGSTWRALDGGTLAAMGPGRYVNRGVGIGFGDLPAAELLDELEAFYRGAGLPPSLEVCPTVPESLLAEMRARGYVLERFRNVYAHDLRRLPRRPTMRIEEVDDELEPAWSGILGSQLDVGSDARLTSDQFCAAVHRIPNAFDFVAVVDGRPVATGSFTAVQTVAWLGGAATLPEARGRGAQYALLVDRLHRAARIGCNLAAVTATPEGVSARNLLRVGFQLLYTQAVMTLP